MPRTIVGVLGAGFLFGAITANGACANAPVVDNSTDMFFTIDVEIPGGMANPANDFVHLRASAAFSCQGCISMKLDSIMILRPARPDEFHNQAIGEIDGDIQLSTSKSYRVARRDGRFVQEDSESHIHVVQIPDAQREPVRKHHSKHHAPHRPPRTVPLCRVDHDDWCDVDVLGHVPKGTSCHCGHKNGVIE